MADAHRRKTLVAVDGSDQSVAAVRYVSLMMPPDQTDVVLFHTGAGFPEVYWDIRDNPLYQSRKEKVMGWLADQQLTIGEFKEKAFKILADAGFSDDQVRVITQKTRTWVLKDILEESYQGYSALVVGRTGVSRIKDLVMGSLAFKLTEMVKHIPIIIVGGHPDVHKVLVALDDATEAMRAVSHLGALTVAEHLEVTLCHCLCQPGAPPLISGLSRSTQGVPGWRKYAEDRFRPHMEDALQRLLDAGMHAGQVSMKFVTVRGNPVFKIIETALVGRFGTVVTGCRENVSVAQRYLRGRFGEQIVRSMDNIAVWIVH